MIVLAGAAAALLGSGVAQADPAPSPSPDPPAVADAPQPGSPLCNVMGGDDGTKWELAPCGWAYGDERGWYHVP
jgi:hypothetical protein